MKHILNPILLLFFVQFSFGSFAQSCFDEIASTEIPESPSRMDEEDPDYIKFLENTNCFLGDDLDTIDLEILTSSPVLVMLVMLEGMENDDAITYGRLKEIMVDFSNKEEYPEARRLHLLNIEYATREAIYANWETDKKMLIDLKIEGELLESFRKYLEEHPNTGKAYQDVMIDYRFEEIMKDN